MTALWLALALTAAPRVALMTGSRVGVSEQEAAQLTEALSSQLKASGLTVVEVNLPCQSDAVCLQKQGRDVGVEAVITVALASGPRQIAIDVETLLVATASSIDQRSLSWKNKARVESLEPQLSACAAEIAARVISQHPPDAPLKVALTPQATPLPPVLIAPAAPVISRAPELITGGAALALGVVAAVLTGVAANQQAALAAAPPFSLTRAEATAQRDAANGTYTAAGITGGAAGALALTSITLFLARR